MRRWRWQWHHSPTDIGTLAYVVTECQQTGDVFSEHQTLHILHGERDVTVMETPGGSSLAEVGLCKLVTSGRLGAFSVAREAIQNLR